MSSPTVHAPQSKFIQIVDEKEKTTSFTAFVYTFNGDFPCTNAHHNFGSVSYAAPRTIDTTKFGRARHNF